VRWGIVLLWMAVIFFLSSQSTLPSFANTWADWLQDIGGHFIAYAVLAGLLWWALNGSGVSRPALWAFLIALLYALSDEYHQSFVPGRHPDPLDIVTDLAGAAAALLWLSRRSRSR